MLKIRHGMLIGLIAVIAAVAYANNSDNQQRPWALSPRQNRSNRRQRHRAPGPLSRQSHRKCLGTRR
jgi:hypothetical protein